MNRIRSRYAPEGRAEIAARVEAATERDKPLKRSLGAFRVVLAGSQKLVLMTEQLESGEWQLRVKIAALESREAQGSFRVSVRSIDFLIEQLRAARTEIAAANGEAVGASSSSEAT